MSSLSSVTERKGAINCRNVYIIANCDDKTILIEQLIVNLARRAYAERSPLSSK